MQKDKSFTIIELLVVISIIGLISSLVLVNIDLPSQKQKAQIAKTLEFSQSIQSALGAEARGIWEFDNNASDTSGYGNSGTLYNFASPYGYATDTPQAFLGQGQGKYSLSFDGVNDYVSTNKIKDLGETTFTLWFNSINPNLTKGILYFRPGFSYGSFNFNWTGDGRPLLYLNSENYRYFSSISNFMDGNWHFLVLYIKGNNQLDIQEASLMIDTRKIGLSSVSTGNAPLDWTGFRIGMSPYGYFNGLIDEVRIYSQTLTIGQIQKHYAEGLGSHQYAKR